MAGISLGAIWELATGRCCMMTPGKAYPCGFDGSEPPAVSQEESSGFIWDVYGQYYLKGYLKSGRNLEWHCGFREPNHNVSLPGLKNDGRTISVPRTMGTQYIFEEGKVGGGKERKKARNEVGARRSFLAFWWRRMKIENGLLQKTKCLSAFWTHGRVYLHLGREQRLTLGGGWESDPLIQQVLDCLASRFPRPFPTHSFSSCQQLCEIDVITLFLGMWKLKLRNQAASHSH